MPSVEERKAISIALFDSLIHNEINYTHDIDSNIYHLNDIQIRDAFIHQIFSFIKMSNDSRSANEALSDKLDTYLNFIDPEQNPIVYSQLATISAILAWQRNVKNNELKYYLDTATANHDSSLNQLIKRAIRYEVPYSTWESAVLECNIEECFKGEYEMKDEIASPSEDFMKDTEVLNGPRNFAKYMVEKFPSLSDGQLLMIKLSPGMMIEEQIMCSVEYANKIIQDNDNEMVIGTYDKNINKSNFPDHGYPILDILLVDKSESKYKSLVCEGESCCPVEGIAF